MIEQLKGKYEFKYYLPPDTEEKVVAIGACLIGRDNEVRVRIDITSTQQQELNNYLNVLEWLRIDKDLYQVYEGAIRFINGSRIDFVNQ